jgi:transcriptional regulator with XRE-family HTH domain
MQGMADAQEWQPPDAAMLERAKSSFAERLQSLRAARGLTQAGAERRAGLGRGQWNRLEAGGQDPQLTTLLRICQALDLETLETLIGDSPSARVLSK